MNLNDANTMITTHAAKYRIAIGVVLSAASLSNVRSIFNVKHGACLASRITCDRVADKAAGADAGISSVNASANTFNAYLPAAGTVLPRACSERSQVATAIIALGPVVTSRGIAL